jgi:hypothetical protein
MKERIALINEQLPLFIRFYHILQLTQRRREKRVSEIPGAKELRRARLIGHKSCSRLIGLGWTL